MEKKFKIYREVVINNPDGTTKILTNEIGSTTLEQLQKDLEVSIQQRDRMQELVDLTNKEIELINSAGENDYIIL
jgi:hypothetical protein